MIQVDLIQLDVYPADSCVISPTAFLLSSKMSKIPMQLNRLELVPIISRMAIKHLE